MEELFLFDFSLKRKLSVFFSLSLSLFPPSFSFSFSLLFFLSFFLSFSQVKSISFSSFLFNKQRHFWKHFHFLFFFFFFFFFFCVARSPCVCGVAVQSELVGFVNLALTLYPPSLGREKGTFRWLLHLPRPGGRGGGVSFPWPAPPPLPPLPPLPRHHHQFRHSHHLSSPSSHKNLISSHKHTHTNQSDRRQVANE